MIIWNWITGILIALIIIPLLLSVLSRFQEHENGLEDGKLHTCPNSPNCVQSEESRHSSYAKPLHYTVTHVSAWHSAEKTIQEMGGNIITNEDGYLHAIFASPLFRFIDDMELRQDKANRTIHFRSSSRVGYSDLGANKKRIDKFRQKVNLKSGQNV